MTAQLKIDQKDLIQALNTPVAEGGSAWYLDMDTGAVLQVSADVATRPENPPARYRAIKPLMSYQSFQVMEDFVETIGDNAVARRLARTLEGRKPFRRFLDALQEFHRVREDWFRFETAAQASQAKAWCMEQGIDVEWVGRES